MTDPRPPPARDGAPAPRRPAALRRPGHRAGDRATAARVDGRADAVAGGGSGRAALDRALRRARGGGAVSAAKPRLDVDATRGRLLALGCGYAAEQLGHLLSEAVRGEVPPHAFLDRLLAAKLSGRGGQVAPVRRARGEGRAARLLGAVLPLRRADDGAAGRRRDAAGAAEATPHRHGSTCGARTATPPNSEVSRRGRRSLSGRYAPQRSHRRRLRQCSSTCATTRWRCTAARSALPSATPKPSVAPV